MLSSTVSEWNNYIPMIPPRGVTRSYEDYYKVLIKITDQFIWLSQLHANV